MRQHQKSASLLGVLLCIAGAVLGQDVTVSDPWVRATVAQQKATGAFMRITSQADASLIAASSPLAGRVELHITMMEAGVAKMRPLGSVELPAGRTVGLEPGGVHVMLLDLKRPLKTGDKVPIRLTIEAEDKSVRNVDIEAEVRPVSAGSHPAH